ncbi:unnamed protein product [Spirodela intermedia]|uniref:Uncharacterized protein n=1 Tax=Spirodela intermedia TaxID=51605 RepID=A0A7I8JT87_SPIIN|nr:unnamed protein product [Spirodela intermedia]CAA6672985.1 unnamed protein product [Spirodela intermedia]
MNWVAVARKIPRDLRSIYGRIERGSKTLKPEVVCSQLQSSGFSAAPRPRSWSPSKRKSESRRAPSLPPTPDPSRLQCCIDQLPPRFTSEDLSGMLELQRDPILCLNIFNWASQQPRFRHDASTYLITIKKLGAARMYQEMDVVIVQALSATCIASEELFNTVIYFYTEARMLSKAVNVFKRMRDSAAAAACRPPLLGKGNNSYINYIYMDTIRCLFRQMVDSGIEPDIFTLNSIIKGYVLSLHINDALRVFHQMGVVYRCLPNEHSYNYLVHGLCAQGRTKNAKELYIEMKNKGLIPSEKVYNSLVCALSMAGQMDEAVAILWEMRSRGRLADLITYRTVLEEMCRHGRVGDAVALLREFQEKDLVDGRTFRELMYGIQDSHGIESGDAVQRSRFSEER